jgi:hypothetical protein
MRVRQADMAYYQFERGMLSQDRLNSALRPILSDADKPVFRDFWKEVGPNQIPAFRDYLNRRIAPQGQCSRLTHADTDKRFSDARFAIIKFACL